MATRDKRRYQRDPSEAQLRVMLEARQHEMEAHRQRTSRTFSMVLVGVVFVISGAIWLIPVAPTSPADSSYATALPALTLRAASTDSSEDVRFAIQLLNFVNPTATPATSKTQATAEAITEVVTKASAAMP